MDQKFIEEFGRTWEDFKNVHERLEGEVKSYGERSAETAEMLERLNNRLDEIETKVARPAASVETKEASSDEMATKAFDSFLRKGSLSPDEAKALYVSDDTTGGYLAPSEYVKDIIKGVIEFSPVRRFARVRETTMRSVQIPKRTGTFSAVWVGERSTRSETTGLTYGMEELMAHEMSAMIDISQQNLEDSAFDLEAEIRAEIAEQFGVAEGAAFVSGNGVSKPEGFLSQSDVDTVNSGHASQITADGLIALYYHLKPLYAANGTWALNRATLKAIRQLKDGENNYIWQPNLGLVTVAGPTILERPYMEVPDMPDVAASAKPIAFGDFRRGYYILDRVAIQMQRDQYTQAHLGNVRFTARKRVGGQVVLPEAFVIQVVSA